jgi:hypothetical protein
VSGYVGGPHYAPVPQYRCVGCGHVFVGERLFCFACSDELQRRADARVPCPCGRTRRPGQACTFCTRKAPVEEAVAHG